MLSSGPLGLWGGVDGCSAGGRFAEALLEGAEEAVALGVVWVVGLRVAAS